MPSMLQYQTRPADHRDEPFLYACYKRTMRRYVERTWGWNEEFQRASFIEHLPWQRFQIIMVGSIAAGAACVLDTPSAIDLEMIIIDPKFQRMGIGSEFLANLLRHARKNQRRIKVRVLKVNPARALYERLGFVVVGEDAGTVEMQAEP
jgi:ribosomal protein S18 acetylase RimI-like enzyme